MKKVHERFLEYVKIHTTSDYNSKTNPSTSIQFDLARKLKQDLEEIGITEVKVDENCNLIALIPANSEKNYPKMGFIAHMDTSPDMSGENVNPQIIKDYKGDDIVLNEDVTLSPKEFPELLDHVGLTLITTDGTTLLGADDKAGIAEIISAMEYIINHPEIEHGDIYIGFTPDEEIGAGTETFNLEEFKADFAYTIDGGKLGEIQYENFNAASASIKIQGRNVHPGSAKNKMINSIGIAFELDSMLPKHMIPEVTEDYEGFYHLHNIDGDVEYTELEYIIRDHDRLLFEEKKNILTEIVNYLNKKYENSIELVMEDSYYNMREKIEPHMEIVDLVIKSMEELDIRPVIEPIRGGTDGARLSFMGLPCPNIFTGGMNFHGKYEYIAIENMEKARDLIIRIVENSKDLQKN